MNIINLIQDGKIKRYLRSRDKLNFPGLVSHITQHSSGRDPLFIEEVDYLYLIKLLREIAAEFGMSVFAFCWMTNHVHILLRQTEQNLSDAMHNLFMRYAFYFNRKYSRKGHLFSGAFRQAACFDNYYLLSSSIYIHLNPVRAGIVGAYSQYRWSSWRLYCKAEEPDTFVDWKFILSMLNTDIAVAKKDYIALLEKTAEYCSGEIMETKTALGTFAARIWRNCPELKMIGGDIFPKCDRPDGYASDAVVNEMIEELRKKKRLNQATDRRARQFVVEQLKARGFTVPEISDFLGLSRTTIYRIITNR